MTGRWAVWLLLPVLVASLVFQVARAGRRWQASRVLSAVKKVTYESSQRGRMNRRLLERNVAVLRKAEELDPTEVSLPIALGGQYLMLGRPEAAIRVFEEARDLEPRGEIFAQLGRAYLKTGDGESANKAFQTAILLDHNQRKQLQGYLGRGLGPSQPRKQARRIEGEIFVESFETGEFGEWRRGLPPKGKKDE